MIYKDKDICERIDTPIFKSPYHYEVRDDMYSFGVNTNTTQQDKSYFVTIYNRSEKQVKHYSKKYNTAFVFDSWTLEITESDGNKHFKFKGIFEEGKNPKAFKTKKNLISFLKEHFISHYKIKEVEDLKVSSDDYAATVYFKFKTSSFNEEISLDYLIFREKFFDFGFNTAHKNWRDRASSFQNVVLSLISSKTNLSGININLSNQKKYNRIKVKEYFEKDVYQSYCFIKKLGLDFYENEKLIFKIITELIESNWEQEKKDLIELSYAK